MPSIENSGIVTLSCRHSVGEAVGVLEGALRARGIKLFAVIDHSGEAERAGLAMPLSKLLIFGNPKAGTPIMIASPLAAIDLPLKILVWEDNAGRVWISYNSPEYIRARHGLTEELAANLAAAEVVARAAGNA